MILELSFVIAGWHFWGIISFGENIWKAAVFEDLFIHWSACHLSESSWSRNKMLCITVDDSRSFFLCPSFWWDIDFLGRHHHAFRFRIRFAVWWAFSQCRRKRILLERGDAHWLGFVFVFVARGERPNSRFFDAMFPAKLTAFPVPRLDSVGFSVEMYQKWVLKDHFWTKIL